MSHGTRVLWLIKGLGLGGAEQLLVSLARTIDRSNIHLEVAYVLPHKDALVPKLGAEVEQVHCLGDGSRGSWVGPLRDLLHTGRFDVVHTHAPVPAVAARLLAPRSTSLLHTEHNVWGRYRRSTRWANSLTLPRNRLVIAVSASVAKSIRPLWCPRSLRPRVEVLLHGVDLDRCLTGEEARRDGLLRLGLGEGPLTIGAVGNLTPKKDHACLLDAFARVHAALPDTRLVIVGTGPLEHRLRARARHLRIAESVFFAGRRSDVRYLLPAFDLFVMSSRHEGLSIALVEALAAGLPVVCTGVGGIPEVVTPSCGVLVPPSRPELLARAIRGLLEDPDRRASMGVAAIHRAGAFDIHNAAAVLTRRYVELAPSDLRTSRRSA